MTLFGLKTTNKKFNHIIYSNFLSLKRTKKKLFFKLKFRNETFKSSLD